MAKSAKLGANSNSPGTPWRGRHATPEKQTESHKPLRGSRSRLSELCCRYAVLLNLEMQGLVIGSEEPRRLALVSPRALEDPSDRSLLGLHRGRLGNLLKRRIALRRLAPEYGHGGRVDGDDREVLRLNHIRGQENCAANDVPELPHVSRPAIAQKNL